LCHKTLFLTSITCAVISSTAQTVSEFRNVLENLDVDDQLLERLEEYNVESVLDEIAESYASQYSGLEILNIFKTIVDENLKLLIDKTIDGIHP